MIFLKSLTMPKKIERRYPLGFFNMHSVAKLQKIEGTLRGNFFPKASPNVEKKTEGGALWSRPVFYVTRETFLAQFPGPTGAI